MNDEQWKEAVEIALNTLYYVALDDMQREGIRLALLPQAGKEATYKLALEILRGF